jgi:alpha-ketoglutarate-dependent taurine dioxygenase
MVRHDLSEKRISYVEYVDNINKLKPFDILELKKLFNKKALIVFKNIKKNENTDLYKFLSKFDDDYNHDVEKSINRLNGIKYDKYLWNSDILKYPDSLPSVVSGYYILENPKTSCTDFICGETVYENLPEHIKKASTNILFSINRKKVAYNKFDTDYYGSYRKETYENIYNDEIHFLPLVFAQEKTNEISKILIFPSFVEKIVGMDIDESRLWLKNYMETYVLPHKMSVRLEKNDLVILNNRRVIYSHKPDDNVEKKQLLQINIPTNRPIYCVKPNFDSLSNVGWFKCKDIENTKKSINNYTKMRSFINLKLSEQLSNRKWLDINNDEKYLFQVR